MIYAVVSSFASVFMLAKGYANAQIGMTLAAANILAVVLQPLTANLADRSQKIGAIGISGIMTVMMMVFTLGMFFFGGGSIALCITFVLLIAWHTALQPMFNALRAGSRSTSGSREAWVRWLIRSSWRSSGRWWSIWGS